MDESTWFGVPVNFPSTKSILFGCEDNGGVQRARQLGLCSRVLPFRLKTWDSDDLPDLRRKALEGDVGLLIIDSLFSVVSSVNEQVEAGRLLNQLRSAGIPVVVVHHQSKGSLDQAGKKPSGAQAYTAAYRNTITVAGRPRVETDGRMLMVLEVDGNDVPRKETLNVEINRNTLTTARVTDLPVGPSPLKQPKVNRLAGLARLAADRSLPPDLDHNEYARRLVGGSQNQEDPALAVECAQAMGSKQPRVKFKTVSDAIRRDLKAFQTLVAEASAVSTAA
jgi:hypothetical protein